MSSYLRSLPARHRAMHESSPSFVKLMLSCGGCR